MARILPHYSLCPLIEQKNFLGLVSDSHPDIVLVTINNNIISRYQISDPKLLSTWNSKGSITSTCVYDSNKCRYLAIFNQNEVRIWTSSEDNIDKVKKFKFTEKLFQLVISPFDKAVIVVFNNGNAFHLDEVIDRRKNVAHQSLIASDQKIVACSVINYLNERVVSVVVEKSPTSISIIGVSLDKVGNIVFAVPIDSQEQQILRSYCLISDNGHYIFTLWSNGELYRDSLSLTDLKIPSNHLTMISKVDLDANVSIKQISPYNLAICGKKDDGILLMIYSIKYNLFQCEVIFEDCNTLPRFWAINSRIYLILGHHLITVPYTEENQKLSALLGSCKNYKTNTADDQLPEIELSRKIICSALSTSNFQSLFHIVSSNCDLSDALILDIMLCCVNNGTEGSNVLQQVLLTRFISDICKIKKSLTMDAALHLLDYIVDLIQNHLPNLQLCKWFSMILDAFYSNFLLSNDIAVLDKLVSYRNLLSKECQSLKDYRNVSTALVSLERRSDTR